MMSMLPAIAVLFPAIAGLLLFANDRRPNVRDTLSLAIAIILVGLLIPLYPMVFSGQTPEWTLATPIPGVPLALRVDALGLLYASIAAVLWIITTVYAVGYMRGANEKHQTRFFYCFALSISAAIGIAFSANLLTLFVFYEVLTMATYPLVTHKGNSDAIRGGRIYLGLLLTTSVGFLVTAIGWTYILAGTLDFTAGGILSGHIDGTPAMILLALFVFGVGKAAMMPFHRWLPSAMVAPTPVSALLHAVAVVKAGVFTIVKVSVYIFGLDLLQTGITQPLLYMACITVVLSSLIAMRQDSIKARLAYSTIGQLGYVTLGAMLATQAGMVGAVMQIAAHAAGKITLFFCAGAFYVAHKISKVSELDGMGRRMPFTFAAFALGALSITGLPPLVGAWPKWFLLQGALDTGQWIALISLVLSSLLNVSYLLGMVGRGFFAPPKTDIAKAPGIAEAPVLMVSALCTTALLALALFFFVDGIDAFIALLPLGASS